MRLAAALPLAIVALCLAGSRHGSAEGIEHFVFLGHSVGKTVEFSYYFDACGDTATGARLRRLALRKLEACELPAERKQAIRDNVAALSVQMDAHVKSCDSDPDCALGKRQYCPGLARQKDEFAGLMDEAESSSPALDRLTGGCN
jgi:hypothetical protein